MANKLSKWDLYDLEKAVEKDKLVELLECILMENNQKKVMEAIKASGYFISYSEGKDEINACKDEQRKKVDDFIRNNMSDRNVKCYDMWEKESQYLRNKRNDISLYINNILATYKIDSEELILYAIDQFNNSNDILHTCIAHKEYTLFCLGQLLKVIIFYEKNNKSNISKKATLDVLNNLWINTMALREFNEIIQSWMFGEVEIEVDENGISIIELPGKNSERILSSLSYWDIMDIKNLNGSIESYIKGSTSEDIMIYEKVLKNKVKEYFYTDNFQEKYLGIMLCSWIKIYRYFKSFAINHKEDPYIKLNLEQLRSDLNINGFTEEQINIIEKYLIFSKTSKDLFDSFLIKIENEIYFIPKFYNFIDASRSIISLFGNEESKSKIESKGKSFENHISNLLTNSKGLKVERNISANDRGEAYEIDLVFLLNDILFFCECKTQFQHQDMRGYFRNRRELENYLEKFKRNYNYFTNEQKGINIIKQRMGLSDIKKSIPIFISNIIYPDMMIDNIYITDEPRIWRYMKRQPALLHWLDTKNKINTMAIFEKFYEGEVNSVQFISYLRNKEEEIKLDNKRIKLWNNESLNYFGIHSERYISSNTY